MKLKVRQYSRGLYEALAEAPAKQVKEIINNFLLVLQKNRQLNLLERIIREYLIYDDEQNEVVTVEATTAVDLKIGSVIKKSLAKKLNRKIEVNEKIDPSIISGLILKYGDCLLDGSLKKRLELLKEELAL